MTTQFEQSKAYYAGCYDRSRLAKAIREQDRRIARKLLYERLITSAVVVGSWAIAATLTIFVVVFLFNLLRS
jgi:hypothetical protein